MPPTFRGGTEEYAYQLARSYSAERPVQVVTTSIRWNDGKNALALGSARLERLGAREVLDRPVLMGARAWARLRELVEGAAVVQLHMPFPTVEKRVTRWAKAAHVPTVLTYHMDAEFGANPRGLVPRLVSGSYRWASALPALRAADVVVSNSMGYAKASPVLSRFLPKVRVIYQGVDLERLRAIDPAAAAQLPPRKPGVGRIVFIGRLVAYKGLPDLLQAVADLLRSGRSVELLIGGRGPQSDELKALAEELGIAEQVTFLGFVPDGAVGRLYGEADVVACPSVSLLESTPITLQEAMAFGTPVVGTTLPGTEETVPSDGVRGRLVPVHDVPALGRALAELLDAGRPPQVEKPRVWSDTASDYLRLFRELESARGATA